MPVPFSAERLVHDRQRQAMEYIMGIVNPLRSVGRPFRNYGDEVGGALVERHEQVAALVGMAEQLLFNQMLKSEALQIGSASIRGVVTEFTLHRLTLHSTHQGPRRRGSRCSSKRNAHLPTIPPSKVHPVPQLIIHGANGCGRCGGRRRAPISHPVRGGRGGRAPTSHPVRRGRGGR